MVLVAVIGAGVVGLTTAIRIQELGHQVVIIADLHPSDDKSIRYTSNWAGAHHVSLAGEDKRQQKMDRETFDVMWKMSEPGAPTESLFLRVPQTEYYVEERKEANPLGEFMPNFRYLTSAELRPGTKSGVTFNTITIDVWRYLAYLYSRFITNGGRAVRAHVQHISQVLAGAFSQVPDALVICAGLGTRSLGGVEDRDMYPIRGQTVLIRAPWVRFGKTASSLDGLWTYVIPRRTGDVILGGTKTDDDWYPKPRPEITQSILERTLALVPELAPPHIHQSGRAATVADLEPLIIETGCGLRPGRRGGIRLERSVVETTGGKPVPIVYNYGHAGYGYQSSWGSATMAVELLKAALDPNADDQKALSVGEH